MKLEKAFIWQRLAQTRYIDGMLSSVEMLRDNYILRRCHDKHADGFECAGWVYRSMFPSTKWQSVPRRILCDCYEEHAPGEVVYVDSRTGEAKHTHTLSSIGEMLSEYAKKAQAGMKRAAEERGEFWRERIEPIMQAQEAQLSDQVTNYQLWRVPVTFTNSDQAELRIRNMATLCNWLRDIGATAIADHLGDAEQLKESKQLFGPGATPMD